MDPQWHLLIRAFGKALEAQNKAEQTRAIYLSSARRFAEWLAETGRMRPVEEVSRREVEAWIAHLLETRKPATAAGRYRALQQFFAWLVTEEEIAESPMAKMRPPTVPEQPAPVLSLDVIKALLKQCEGTDLISRRDAALIRLLIDTGGRVSEIAGLTVEAVDLDHDTVTVLGKGSRPRVLPIGSKTSLAIARYLRVRGKERQADRPELWLGEKSKGPLQSNGIKLMVRRRGRALDPPRELNPHLFRHTAAHEWLAAGGQESDLMRLMGWRSPQMLRRYGSSLADERARDAHRTKGLGDRL